MGISLKLKFQRPASCRVPSASCRFLAGSIRFLGYSCILIVRLQWMRRYREASSIRRIHRMQGVFKLEIRFQSRFLGVYLPPPPPGPRTTAGLPNSGPSDRWRPPPFFDPFLDASLAASWTPQAQKCNKNKCFFNDFEIRLGRFWAPFGSKRGPKKLLKINFWPPRGLKTHPFFYIFFWRLTNRLADLPMLKMQ